MATDETTIGIIAAVISGIALAIREVGAGVIRAIRGNTKAQEDKAVAEAAARDEDRRRSGEAAQWDEIRATTKEFNDKLGAHELEDATRFASLETKMDRAQEDLSEIKQIVKDIRKNGTGKVRKPRDDDAPPI